LPVESLINPLNAKLNPICHLLAFSELTIFSTLAGKGLISDTFTGFAASQIDLMLDQHHDQWTQCATIQVHELRKGIIQCSNLNSSGI